MDYATVILWRKSGNINHSKDNLRLFLKTKEVIHIFSLYSTVPRHNPYRYFCGYHESPQCSVFPLPIYYLLSPQSIVFSFPSFCTLLPNHGLLPSALLQIHCFHYHFPYSWGTSALKSTLQFFLRLCLALSIAGMPLQGKQQLQESRRHLWLDSEPLQAARNPQLQLQSKSYFHWFFPFKLLLNDTNKQAQLHQYYQKQVSSSGYLISGTLGLVQKTTYWLPERRFWENQWQCVQQGTRKMRSPEERPIQVCRF